MDKKTFLDIVDKSLVTDDRPQWLVNMVLRPAWLYYRVFVGLARHVKPELIVELGTHRGTGAAHFKYGCPEARVVTVDIHRHNQTVESFTAKKDIESVVCDSAQYAKRMGNETVDILFIDANHTYESLLADFNAWLPKMKAKGIMLFDDIYFDDIMTPHTVTMFHGIAVGESANCSQAWKEIKERQYGETFEIRKLHKRASFGIILL